MPIDFIGDGDLKVIAAPMDFSGINFYETKTVLRSWRAFPSGERAAGGADGCGGPLTANGIDARPAGLGRVLRRLSDEYPAIPLYITENGAPFFDSWIPKDRSMIPSGSATWPST